MEKLYSDLFMCSRSGQFAEPGPGDLLQHGPHHLVPHPAHVEGDAPVELPGLGDDEGVGGGDLREERRVRVRGLRLPAQLLVSES